MPYRTGLLLVCLTASVAAAEGPPRVDAHGDPLPADAIARLGTVRWRHGHHVSGLAFTPDKKQVVSIANDATLRVWDVASGKEVRRIASPIDANNGAVNAIALSPDGKLLALPFGDKLYFWELATGKALPTWEGKAEDGFGEVCFSPDGKTLAVTGSAIVLWDIAEHKAQRRFRTLRGASAPAFSHDGRLIAAGDGNVIRVWEAATGKQVQRLVRHNDRVSALAFAPDGKTLVSAGDDNAVRLWDLATGKAVHQMGHPNTRTASTHFVIDNNTSIGASVAFLPDGRSLVSCVKGDRLIRQWDVATGKELRAFAGHQDGSLCISLSADGTTLAAGAEDSTVRLWDVATGKELFAPEGHRGRVFTVGAAPDGKTVFTAGRDNGVRVWDAATGRLLRAFGEDADRMGLVAFSPDGKVMASARMDDEMIQVWDLTTGKLLRELELLRNGVAALSFTADGKVLAALTEDEDFVVQWELPEGKRLHAWKAEATEEQPRIVGGIKMLAFAPDGRTVALLAGGKFIQLCDAATGKLVRKIETEEERAFNVFRLLFSPDGRTLAAAARDNTLTLWSPATGARLHQFTELGLLHPQGMVNMEAVAFSPDGKLVAAAGPNGSVRVWEVATGSEVRQLQTDVGWVSGLAFGADSRTVIAGGLNTTALVLDVSGHRSGAVVPAADATEQALEARWNDLLADKGATAYRALWDLAATPVEAVPFLRKHIRPAAPADPKRLAKLVADLDSNQFAVRKKAATELEGLGELAEDALHKALEAQPSPDARSLIEEILRKNTSPQPTGEQRRTLRAITVLEQAGTPEARELLAAVARGVGAARQTREAKAALQRLERRAAAAE